jgi:hypothetical protein
VGEYHLPSKPGKQAVEALINYNEVYGDKVLNPGKVAPTHYLYEVAWGIS